MPAASSPVPAPNPVASDSPLYVVKTSPIHGRGVFARRAIAPGDAIIEYTGQRITWDEANRRRDDNDPLNLTYFFTLNDGRVIDGGVNGNEARYINHSCEPNCEAIEYDDGSVWIHALYGIERGDELSYDYTLIYEGRHTPAIKRAFACHCGAPTCSGSMLMSKRSARYRANMRLMQK